MKRSRTVALLGFRYHNRHMTSKEKAAVILDRINDLIKDHVSQPATLSWVSYPETLVIHVCPKGCRDLEYRYASLDVVDSVEDAIQVGSNFANLALRAISKLSNA
jgi:hypothetical protein